ncbi:hypothetical protein [Gemmobacter sp. 24YEA27]|uniref:hypothetical protein n=1 Tax=Gemmobacter sp. 24YEA27 TaxID=3040672 RepID=UPI0024B32FF5|nr:hypothetical protein [Gemmobacter sp. 24YEA27]
MVRVARFALVQAVLMLGAAMLTAFLVTMPASAEEAGLKRVSVPEWVDYLPDITTLSGIGSDEIDRPRYLLREMQFTWEGGRRQIWERQVIEMETEGAATEAGTQIFDYNSALEDFTLTGASLWRDGEEIQLWNTPQMAVELFSASYEASPLNPQYFVMMTFPTLRAGDSLDLSFLRISRPDLSAPERGLDLEAVAPLQFDDRVTLARAVVNWPGGREIFTPALPDEVTLATGPVAGGGTRYDYQLFDFITPPGEELVPSWVDERAVLRVSGDRDWGRIATILAGHYAADWPLGPWQARVDALRPADGGAITTKEIAAALLLVQNEIGDSGVPGVTGRRLMTPPAEVALRGLGSAAEKALLLRSMLRRLGVEADVALTSFDYGRALDRLPPSMAFLDLALVRVELEGQFWWLDPSRPPQAARLEAMSPPDFGFALPLMAGITQPVVMEAEPAAIWTSDVKETWRFTPAGLFLDVASEHRGSAADDLRYRYTELGIGDISAELLGYYQIVFPQMAMIREPDFTDDAENNIVRMHERYFLPASVIRDEGVMTGFALTAEDFTAQFPAGGADYLRSSRRKWPMIGLSPGHYRHRAELRGRFGMLTPPQAVQLENPAFSYRLEGAAPGPGQLMLQWDFTAMSTDIALSDLPKVLDDAQIVHETTWFNYDLD